MTAIEPYTEIATGRGRLVVSRFRHSQGEVYDLRLVGSDGIIGVTAQHPLWSATRGVWVSAAELELGERLSGIGQTADRGVGEGTGVVVEVASLLPRGQEPVYNIEVDADHCYRVGEQGLLVHNMSAPAATPATPAADSCSPAHDWGSLRSGARAAREELLTLPGLSPEKRTQGILGGRTTVATASVVLNGQPRRLLKGYSGRSNATGFVEYVPNAGRQLPAIRVEGNLRDADPEVKILELVYNMTTEQSSGCIRIFIDGPKDVCRSCVGVIMTFESRRPCIIVQTMWRGGSSAVLPDTPGQWDIDG
ncbi:hypothetical protein [Tuwongella immobilis]|uniref:Intein C-terminal splicing domain-containing protein n=1 Tax=Tuwongella immobilis TaxID=692036 RepID=A0A6C2YRX3_9BACT|nr:hypothetical protein [Tuwongella immobilis]VIP03725.1 Uncharacterized protein OS=Planctomyces maris DSM 8797 GN=PM8797T_02039 PE=4 SV=1: PT-HINT [Tuwongella immobilis]VTS04818.1 Uncharacterized protein OS=Planctomyces maris DSM 8797 GN=PM8797T_02039 PE=4 SV=1: PT-HINT [Tuwongella immobilis]